MKTSLIIFDHLCTSSISPCLLQGEVVIILYFTCPYQKHCNKYVLGKLRFRTHLRKIKLLPMCSKCGLHPCGGQHFIGFSHMLLAGKALGKGQCTTKKKMCTQTMRWGGGSQKVKLHDYNFQIILVRCLKVHGWAGHALKSLTERGLSLRQAAAVLP